METRKIQKLFRENFNKRDNFKQISDYLVDNYTVDIDDERKRDVSADTAVGMAMGVAMAKNEFMLKGLAIGALGTGLAVAIGNKIIKSREQTYKVRISHLHGETAFIFIQAINEDLAIRKAKDTLMDVFGEDYDSIDISLVK